MALKTFSDFKEALAEARYKGTADWRIRSILGGLAMKRAAAAPSISDASGNAPLEDFSDLIDALDHVVGGRRSISPEMDPVLATLQRNGGVR